MMRLAIGATAIGFVAAAAHADARFASLHMDSVSCDVAENLNVSGEGTSSLGLSGSVGPVVGGAPQAFSLTINLSFDSFSVPGDGFVSFISLKPTFGSGTLEVMDFATSTDLYSGASFISHVEGIGVTPMTLDSGSTSTLPNFALAYTSSGASSFDFIGDNGGLTATLEFMWTGSNPGDSLTIDVLPDSSIAYSFFVPTPGAACVMGLGALPLIGRRRRA